MHALGDSIIKDLRTRVPILRFHADWIRRSYADDIEIAALSLPRGGAKSWLLGQMAGQSIRPGSPTFQQGMESIAVSGSLEQSRILLGFVREALQDVEDDYRWLDSGQRLACTHKDTGTKLRVLSSSGKRAMGLANFQNIYFDEPGSLNVRDGLLLWDALRTSLGKRPCQRLLCIGTRAPAPPDTWWPQLLDAGSGRGMHIEVLTAPDDAPWDAWSTIRKVNPLLMHNASLRRTVLRERDAARRDETLRPAFRAYRLNQQVDIEQEVLVEVADWKRVEAREVPPRQGRPIVGFDLGAERSWSAAFCVYPNGRAEAYALMPGLPGIAERERQDSQPSGLYRRLYESGNLLVDEGRRVSRPLTLINHLLEVGITPESIYCDTFILGELRDAVNGRWPIIPRRTRWSEATEDISGFRRLVKDGPLSITEESRPLVRLGLSEAIVKSDDQGSVHLRKKRSNQSRDDVAVAAVIATGAMARALVKVKRPRWRYRGAA